MSYEKVMRIALFLLPCFLAAEEKRDERWWSAWWAERNGGEANHYIEADGSFADAITDSHIVEVEWAPKWKHSIGQALNYAAYRQQRAKIVLLLEEEDEQRYFLRCKSIVILYGLPIDVEAVRIWE